GVRVETNDPLEKRLRARVDARETNPVAPVPPLEKGVLVRAVVVEPNHPDRRRTECADVPGIDVPCAGWLLEGDAMPDSGRPVPGGGAVVPRVRVDMRDGDPDVALADRGQPFE